MFIKTVLQTGKLGKISTCFLTLQINPDEKIKLL